MHRLMTSWLCLGVLAAISCGAPAELDESIFPGPGEVGYSEDNGTGSTGTPLGGGAGAGGSSAVGNSGNSGSSAAPPANGASGAAPSSGGGGTPVAAGGSAQAGAAGGGSAPVAGGAAGGGCPDDITVLFNRPISEGGCGGDACHVPGGTSPDLVSPNIEARLLDEPSQCGGRPYLGAGDSFLEEKIAGEQPECGYPMPFLQPDNLKDADKQCILDWIAEVTGG